MTPPSPITIPARTDTWATIRTGWVRSGDQMPRAGSLAWRLLDADDPVRLAAQAAVDLGAADGLRRHGPAVARALAELKDA